MIEARDLVMDYTAGMARVQADHSVTGVMPRGAGTGGPHPYAAGGTGHAMPAVHTLALNHVNFDLAPGETVAVMANCPVPASRRCCTRSPASSARRRAR